MKSSPPPEPPRLPATVPHALRDAYDAAPDDATRSKLLYDMVLHVEEHSRWEAIELAEAALDAAMRANDTELTIRAALLAAFQLNEAGRFDEAYRHVVESLALAATIRDVNPDPYLRAVSTRATIRATVGDESAARRDYEMIIETAVDPVTKFVARINLASLLADMENARLALFHEVVARQAVNEEFAAGRLAADAHRYFTTSLDLVRVSAQCIEAQRLMGRDLPDDAPALIDAAMLTLGALLDDADCGPFIELTGRTWAAAAYRLSGDLDRAESEARRAVLLAHQLGHHTSPQAWVELATVLDSRGQTLEARAMWNEAVAVSERLNSTMRLVRVLPRLAEHYERAGDVAMALDVTRRAFRRALQVSSAISDLNDVAAATDDLIEAGDESLSWRDRFFVVEQQAKLDPLTGLLNRRGMLAAIQRVQTERTGSGLLIIALLDIDHFKSINDTYSHHVGDTVLSTVGRLMVDSVPRGAHVGRHGGEEFSMIVCVDDLPAARALLERVRLAIADYDWSPVAEGLSVHISGGFSVWSPGTTASDALAVADRRLYDAKRQGRHRIVGPE